MLTLVSNISSKGIARIRNSDIFCLFCLGHVPDMWDLTSLGGGSNFRLLRWKHRLLATGPPGKSRISDFLKKKRLGSCMNAVSVNYQAYLAII